MKLAIAKALIKNIVVANDLESEAIRESRRLLHTFLEKYGEKQRVK